MFYCVFSRHLVSYMIPNTIACNILAILYSSGWTDIVNA
jgi:hypothetical protein